MCSYAEWQKKTAASTAGPFSRSYIFYNVDPNNATTQDRKTFTLDSLVSGTVNGLKSTGGIFITSADIESSDVYASFSSIWQQFVKSVASISK